jgi:UDP-N-acetylmuramate--alanine ligase
MEHVDYFKSMEQIRDSFTKYASLVGREGTVIYNIDDPDTVISAGRVEAAKISFGLSEGALVRATNINLDSFPIEFDIEVECEPLTHIKLPAFGMHSVYNALAATAASLACGISVEAITKGLADFKGAGRRMEYKGELNGAVVYDDYGHHPTEVGATLAGARKACRGRLICVFQPHTFSRTIAFFDDFVSTLSMADHLLLADIYSAREEDTGEVSSKKLADAIAKNGIDVHYFPTFDEIEKFLEKNISTNDARFATSNTGPSSGRFSG